MLQQRDRQKQRGFIASNAVCRFRLTYSIPLPHHESVSRFRLTCSVPLPHQESVSSI